MRNDRTRDITAFLTETRWIERVDDLRFLAAGEYNENYEVRSGDQRYVFRINHGTQLGVPDQIRYEFDALTAVAASGVTPLPLHVCRRHRAFPNGVLLMSYIEGGRFDYAVHAAGAARVFARIHSLPTVGNLIVQANPVMEIVAECERLLSRYQPHPMPEVGDHIRRYRDHVAGLGREYHNAFDEEPLCIVNTEVNSGNFIVGSDATVYLVDWEKAVVSRRYQDLGHFLVPTTTLWKSDYRFTAEARAAFLHEYANALPSAVDPPRLDTLTAVLEQTILLRALSWCYMAYVEYTSEHRALKNAHTYSRITHYLTHVDEYLQIP